MLNVDEEFNVVKVTTLNSVVEGSLALTVEVVRHDTLLEELLVEAS